MKTMILHKLEPPACIEQLYCDTMKDMLSIRTISEKSIKPKSNDLLKYSLVICPLRNPHRFTETPSIHFIHLR